MIRLKKGVRLHGLTVQALWGMDRVDEVWQEFGFKECLISSIGEGTHSKKSLHYHGRAFDVSCSPLDPTDGIDLDTLAQMKNRLREALPDFDVLLHGEVLHFHVEWDPKGPPR